MSALPYSRRHVFILLLMCNKRWLSWRHLNVRCETSDDLFPQSMDIVACWYKRCVQMPAPVHRAEIIGGTEEACESNYVRCKWDLTITQRRMQIASGIMAFKVPPSTSGKNFFRSFEQTVNYRISN